MTLLNVYAGFADSTRYLAASFKQKLNDAFSCPREPLIRGLPLSHASPRVARYLTRAL
jgi:hypothetical protein